jgi:cell division ATPase FtsA
VKESLRQGGVVEALGAGCVLTGGGSMLPGMLDVTESQLRVPARAGLPVRLSHMPGELVILDLPPPSACFCTLTAPRDAGCGKQQSARQAARHLCSQFLNP